MNNKWYIKLQLLGYSVNEKPPQSKTNDLKDFCKMFGLKAHEHEVFQDTFYVLLPDKEYDACLVMNAFDAYCYFHNIAHRLASEKVNVPLFEFLKSLKNEGI